MRKHPDDLPPSERAPNRLIVETTVGIQNAAKLNKLTYKLIGKALVTTLKPLIPRIIDNHDFLYYRFFGVDNVHHVLLSRQSELVGKKSTAIFYNIVREPEPDEPNFPDGKTAILQDFAVGDRQRGLFRGFSQEILYRQYHAERWPGGHQNLRIAPADDVLQLARPIGKAPIEVESAWGVAERERHMPGMFAAFGVLRLCINDNMVEDIPNVSICSNV